MNQRTRLILEDLETVRENLLALSDEIWDSIDHNDNDSLERGFEFKREFNQKMAAFDATASELSGMIQHFTDVNLNVDEQSGLNDETANSRIVEQLNRETPHTLSENFTWCRPFGFILDGQAASGVPTWKRLYELLCRQLHRRDPEKFRSLPENRRHISKRGHRAFCTDSSHHRMAAEIADDVYAEVNLSANSIRNEIRRLLKTFEIPEDSLQIFLREDRNARQMEENDA